MTNSKFDILIFLTFSAFDDVPMTIERGCTSEADESLYKCQTLEDGSRLENYSEMKLTFKISAIFAKSTSL